MRAADAQRYIASDYPVMRMLPAIIITIALISPHVHAKQSNNAAEKSWRPFFAAFRAAVKKRDRDALKKMMVPDFFFSGVGGDDNGDGQTRDEAFEFWDDPHVRGWQALDRTLAQGTVPMAAWWDQGKRREYVSRVGPPAANIRRNLTQVRIDWYAVLNSAMAVGTARSLFSVAIDIHGAI